ncbi:hypothetical protein H8959_001832 [Pygathrix nigripes]
MGLCLRIKLQRCLPFKHKLEIYISEGTHSTEEDISTQINNKEQVEAAMENLSLWEIVEQCVLEPDCEMGEVDRSCLERVHWFQRPNAKAQSCPQFIGGAAITGQMFLPSILSELL